MKILEDITRNIDNAHLDEVATTNFDVCKVVILMLCPKNSDDDQRELLGDESNDAESNCFR